MVAGYIWYFSSITSWVVERWGDEGVRLLHLSLPHIMKKKPVSKQKKIIKKHRHDGITGEVVSE